MKSICRWIYLKLFRDHLQYVWNEKCFSRESFVSVDFSCKWIPMKFSLSSRAKIAEHHVDHSESLRFWIIHKAREISNLLTIGNDYCYQPSLSQFSSSKLYILSVSMYNVLSPLPANQQNCCIIFYVNSSQNYFNMTSHASSCEIT